MYDEWGERGPIDSEDAFAMGLRGPRCNGCKLAKLRYELGDKFLLLHNTVYELDAEPAPGQGQPEQHKGRPIKHHLWVMSPEHSNECYHWTPPSEP